EHWRELAGIDPSSSTAVRGGIWNVAQERGQCQGNTADQRQDAPMRKGSSQLATKEVQRDGTQGPNDLKVTIDPVRVGTTPCNDAQRYRVKSTFAYTSKTTQQGEPFPRGAEDRCTVSDYRQRDGDECNAPKGKPGQSGRYGNCRGGEREELDGTDEACTT